MSRQLSTRLGPHFRRGWGSALAVAKVGYSRREAERLAEKLAQRCYRCPDCKRYHLTTRTRAS